MIAWIRGRPHFEKGTMQNPLSHNHCCFHRRLLSLYITVLILDLASSSGLCYLFSGFNKDFFNTVFHFETSVSDTMIMAFARWFADFLGCSYLFLALSYPCLV